MRRQDRAPATRPRDSAGCSRTVGNGNDVIQLGNGSNVVVEGNGRDSVSAGNGNNLILGGLGPTRSIGRQRLQHPDRRVGDGHQSRRLVPPDPQYLDGEPDRVEPGRHPAAVHGQLQREVCQLPVGRRRHRLVLLQSPDDLEQEVDGLPELNSHCQKRVGNRSPQRFLTLLGRLLLKGEDDHHGRDQAQAYTRSSQAEVVRSPSSTAVRPVPGVPPERSGGESCDLPLRCGSGRRDRSRAEPQEQFERRSGNTATPPPRAAACSTRAAREGPPRTAVTDVHIDGTPSARKGHRWGRLVRPEGHASLSADAVSLSLLQMLS
jgi:Ca2+-binding RTX toxin-like protein